LDDDGKEGVKWKFRCGYTD